MFYTANAQEKFFSKVFTATDYMTDREAISHLTGDGFPSLEKKQEISADAEKIDEMLTRFAASSENGTRFHLRTHVFYLMPLLNPKILSEGIVPDLIPLIATWNSGKAPNGFDTSSAKFGETIWPVFTKFHVCSYKDPWKKYSPYL